jgi:micrococcal nuclease
MVRTRLYPFTLASLALTCLVMLVQGCKKAEERPPPSRPAVSARSKPTVAPTQPSLPTPPSPSKVLSNIPAAQTQAHIGETNTVCGLVAGGRFLESSKGKPTFLNFDRPFPDHTFSVVIFESGRAKFKSPPEVLFDHKTVCVTGRIVDFKGKPEIVVEEPSQIVIQEATPTTLSRTASDADHKTPAVVSETTTNSSQKAPTIPNVP